MSRSRKKNPYVSTTCVGSRAGMQKDWKAECNQRIRGQPVDVEIPKGRGYRKITEAWSAPNDGKHLWDEPRGYRK
jgi:hypothetical protein